MLAWVSSLWMVGFTDDAIIAATTERTERPRVNIHALGIRSIETSTVSLPHRRRAGESSFIWYLLSWLDGDRTFRDLRTIEQVGWGRGEARDARGRSDMRDPSVPLG